VELTVTNRDGFRSWLLSFLDRAEVLAPEELRADMVAWLHGVISSESAS
jgi:predicted DNA-binding transcriptional regulator YafY